MRLTFSLHMDKLNLLIPISLDENWWLRGNTHAMILLTAELEFNASRVQCLPDELRLVWMIQSEVQHEPHILLPSSHWAYAQIRVHDRSYAVGFTDVALQPVVISRRIWQFDFLLRTRREKK